MKTAKWWQTADNNSVICTLCPRRCTIPEGKTGYCGIRKNEEGSLVSLAYGLPAALQIDPIEKKPLRHFLPGTKTFSVGTFGCNLGCVFCQNSHFSRGSYGRQDFRYIPPEELVKLTLQHKCESLTFTYNEPSIWAEYAVDCFRLAKAAGLKTVLVSNGFISREAAEELYPLTDAANIDIKAMSEEFYRTMCNASLQPVLESCIHFKRELGKHLEITNLVIPGKNDSPEQIRALLDWVEQELGLDQVIHFSAYFPAYRYHESPRTPPGLIRKICAEAFYRGFSRIYAGNI
ncbi:MAG: AmmeMemoRadiSam system radical SAM enzyme [Lentisphaeria bacterium]|nr:AmmeMemoRadiSam system radical SAM enzyme [Lentisphaeria bacterium]MBR4076370.1 AmmeMemoRadiSam system radical SAM enzyme [Lentisphaeria bacterium]